MYNEAVMHALNDEVGATQHRVSASHLLSSSLAFAFSSLCSSLACAFPSLFSCLSLSSFLAFAFASLRSSLPSSLFPCLFPCLCLCFPSLSLPTLSLSHLLLLSYLFPCLPFPTCLGLLCFALLCPRPYHACSSARMHMLHAFVMLARSPGDGCKCIAAQYLQSICWVFNMCMSLSIHCCCACIHNTWLLSCVDLLQGYQALWSTPFCRRVAPQLLCRSPCKQQCFC